MKISSIRDLEGLRPVLKDKDSTGQDPVYWVFNEIGGEPWVNITVTAPGNYNGEFPKTFGHYHSTMVPETYHVLTGNGVMMLQSKFMEAGKWVDTKVAEVLLVKAGPGDEVVITPEWGHSWSNIGKTALVTYDNWSHGHDPSDYEPMQRLRGLAYYLVQDGEDVKFIPNPTYQDLPDPVWLTAAEFKKRQGKI